MLGATTMSTDLVAIMSATKMPVILLGFLLAFCIRAAVGSATAAMLTSIAIAGPVCLASGMSPIIAGLSVCLWRQRRHLPDGRYLLVSVHLQRPRYQRLPRHYDDPLHSVRCHRHGHCWSCSTPSPVSSPECSERRFRNRKRRILCSHQIRSSQGALLPTG